MLTANYAGSYAVPFGPTNNQTYLAGFGFQTPAESRNWFVFTVPVFPAPLIAAELRVPAGFCSTNSPTTYELHPVTTPVATLINYSSRTNTFIDLGDGPVLGSRVIGLSESARQNIPGALLSVPLNAAGLSALQSAQGSQMSFGGAVPRTATRVYAFGFNTLGSAPIQLVLYYSNTEPPQVTMLTPGPAVDFLADERFSFSGTVCGRDPLQRWWEKNGVPIGGATNDVLDLNFLRPSDSGSYRLRGSNDIGSAASDPIDIRVVPMRIAVQPQALFLNEGENGYLEVTVNTRLPESYQWRKNGISVAGWVAPAIYFNSAGTSDSGQYDVVISNAAGSVTSRVVQVTVIIPPPEPPFIPDLGPDSLDLAVGTYLSLGYYPEGALPMQYQWYKDGQEIPGANGNTGTNTPYVGLFNGSVGFNDAGAYWVVVANVAGAATSKVTHVTVQPLVIGMPFLSAEIAWRSYFIVQPVISSTAFPTFQWYFNDQPLPGATNQNVVFPAFDYVNEGRYFVIGRNGYGAVTSSMVTLTVVTQAPTVAVTVTPANVWVGENAVLQAYVSGGPPPTLQWYFENQLIENATKTVLELKDVTGSMTGHYLAIARNIYGSATSAPVVLTVFGSQPFFVNVPGTNTVWVEGDIAMLRVQAVGGPAPTYQWRRAGVDLPGQTNNVLAFDRVRMSDAGTYDVIAGNEHGSVQHRATLRVRPATGLDRWRWRYPRPQGSRLYKATYGGGRYVATGKAGNVITSEDSVDWTSVTLPIEDIGSLAYGNGVFVAFGYVFDPLIVTNYAMLVGDMAYRYLLQDYPQVGLVSSNGLEWSVAQDLVPTIYDVVFGNGMFVAASTYAQALCYTSVDGRHWQPRRFAGLNTYQVAFGAGTFVVRASDGNLYYSTDTINWSPCGLQYVDLTGFVNGRFIALAYTRIYESLDGITWREAAFNDYPYPSSVPAGNGNAYVALADIPYGQILYGTDLGHWLPIDTGTRQQIEAVIYANGQFLAFGDAGVISRSADGRGWTPDEVANKIDFYGVTHGNGLHVVAGDAGTILTSSNAVDWVKQATPSMRNLHAVTCANGIFVAGGRGGALMTSSNGVTWTARDSGISNYIERIAFADGRWMAVAEGSDITTASGGIVSWTTINRGQFSPVTDHEGIASGNGLWVVVGGFNFSSAVGTVYTSSNIVAWTQRAANPGKRWRDVAYARGKFVTVGNDGTMAYSMNGIDWSTPTFIGRQNLRRVHYANGRFVAVGNDGTLLSSPDPTNGLPWIVHRAQSSQNLHDVFAVPDGTFIYVGNNGMILQSGNTRPHFLSVARDGRLEFDRGIADTLRLERSTDLRTWETEALNVTSPHMAPVGNGSKFWRISGE